MRSLLACYCLYCLEESTEATEEVEQSFPAVHRPIQGALAIEMVFNVEEQVVMMWIDTARSPGQRVLAAHRSKQ